MNDLFVYLILAAAFCVIPTVVIGAIILTIRYLTKSPQTARLSRGL